MGAENFKKMFKEAGVLKTLGEFEKMFEEGFEFETTAEVDYFELFHHAVLRTDSKAGRSAIKVYEEALEREKISLDDARAKMVPSEEMDKIKAKIVRINWWIADHPELREFMTEENRGRFCSLKELEDFERNNPGVIETTPAVNKAARECVDFELAEIRDSFEWAAREYEEPNFVQWANRRKKEISELEAWLEKHPAIDSL